MPRNIRNFYVTVDVDGRASRVETGPRSKEGGMKITLLNRKQGEIDTTSLTVECHANPTTGKLVISVTEGAKQVLYREVDR